MKTGLFENVERRMAIYTRMGSPVLFTAARISKVWVTVGNIGNGVECKWHYSEPKRTKRWRKDVRVETMHVWHVTAQYKDDGRPFSAGELSLHDFVADGAIQEILAECYRLNPKDAAWERETFGEAA
jgi:hypothetical protein